MKRIKNLILIFRERAFIHITTFQTCLLFEIGPQRLVSKCESCGFVLADVWELHTLKEDLRYLKALLLSYWKDSLSLIGLHSAQPYASNSPVACTLVTRAPWHSTTNHLHSNTTPTASPPTHKIYSSTPHPTHHNQSRAIRPPFKLTTMLVRNPTVIPASAEPPLDSPGHLPGSEGLVEFRESVGGWGIRADLERVGLRRLGLRVMMESRRCWKSWA